MERIPRRSEEHPPWARGYTLHVARRDAISKIRDERTGALEIGVSQDLVLVSGWALNSAEGKLNCAACLGLLQPLDAVAWATERREPVPQHISFLAVCAGCAECRTDDALKELLVKTDFTKQTITLTYVD